MYSGGADNAVFLVSYFEMAVLLGIGITNFAGGIVNGQDFQVLIGLRYETVRVRDQKFSIRGQ